LPSLRLVLALALAVQRHAFQERDLLGNDQVSDRGRMLVQNFPAPLQVGGVSSPEPAVYYRFPAGFAGWNGCANPGLGPRMADLLGFLARGRTRAC
jgi:hypothetical protein